MASTITFWSPDTCGCKMFYEWDTDVAPETRVHTYKTLEEAQAIANSIASARIVGARARTPARKQPDPVVCPAHASLGQVPALYATVVDENRRKNVSLGIAESSLGDAARETQWEFDGARVLRLQFSAGAFPPQQIARLQAAVDLQFGPGKVSVS